MRNSILLTVFLLASCTEDHQAAERTREQARQATSSYVDAVSRSKATHVLQGAAKAYVDESMRGTLERQAELKEVKRLKPDETCLGGTATQSGTIVVRSIANGVPQAIQLLENSILPNHFFSVNVYYVKFAQTSGPPGPSRFALPISIFLHAYPANPYSHGLTPPLSISKGVPHAIHRTAVAFRRLDGRRHRRASFTIRLPNHTGEDRSTLLDHGHAQSN